MLLVPGADRGDVRAGEVEVGGGGAFLVESLEQDPDGQPRRRLQHLGLRPRTRQSLPAGEPGPERGLGGVRRRRDVEAHLVQPAAGHDGRPHRLPVPGHGTEQLPRRGAQEGPVAVVRHQLRAAFQGRRGQLPYVPGAEVEVGAAALGDALELHARVRPGRALGQQGRELAPLTTGPGRPGAGDGGPEGACLGQQGGGPVGAGVRPANDHVGSAGVNSPAAPGDSRGPGGRAFTPRAAGGSAAGCPPGPGRRSRAPRTAGPSAPGAHRRRTHAPARTARRSPRS